MGHLHAIEKTAFEIWSTSSQIKLKGLSSLGGLKVKFGTWGITLSGHPKFDKSGFGRLVLRF